MEDALYSQLRSALKKIHCPGMLAELDRQYNDPNCDLWTAEERIERLISSEEESRRQSKVNKLMRQAKFRLPEACIDEEMYAPGTLVSKEVLDKLATCEWIKNKRNLVITGPTGSGKTWAACALGICAVMQLKTVRYFRCAPLLTELRKAEEQNELYSVIKDINKADLLILDDFCMNELDLNKCRNVFELLENRENKGATIFASQFPVSSWHSMFENGTYADACLDRAVVSALRLTMGGTSHRIPKSETNDKS